MTFSYTTTGATNQSSIVRGNVGFVSGTWNAASVTKGEIVTGGTFVLSYWLNNLVTEKGIKSGINADGDGTASNGSIGILACTSSDTGTWGAFVLLSGTSVS